MNALQRMIKEASQQYYTTGESKLSDSEFDALLEQERKVNPQSDLLKVGHGYDVEEDTTYGDKAPHRYGLVGSLGKCKVFKDFISTFTNCETDTRIMSSAKLDGLSIVLYFENGQLVQAVTRGDGYEGIDVTAKVKYITKMDRMLDDTFTGAIRGEIVMSHKAFEEFHLLHPESKNPRNSAAGLINNKEITTDLDFVDIVFYTIVGSENKIFSSYKEVLEYLRENLINQRIVPYMLWDRALVQSDDRLQEFMGSLKTRWYREFPCDGIVNASNELNVSGADIMYTANAFKFKAESKETTVTGIEWRLSKTGYLVPRINFEPIVLSGATVQYCAGHNALNVKEIGIGVGARISVMRSNEVIPYLEEVIEKGDDYELPTVCPACGTTLVMNGVHLQCPNRECKNTDVQDMLIWMDCIAPVDGLGDTLKLRFLTEMLGEDNLSVESIYKHGPLKNTYSRLVKQQLFNETFNRMFTDEIRLDSAILALNIPRFGDITAGKLAKYPMEIQKLYIEGSMCGPLEKLQYSQALQSIGNANYQSLLENDRKMKRLNLIKDHIKWSQEMTSAYKGEVCITGKLSVKRAIFEEELRAAGYVATDSVKKTTKYLITDDPNSGSSKNKAADKNNIPKVTERDFRARYM